jgi:superfamily I DNA and/or RNA helicase
MRRMNVGLTRAKCSLFVLGHAQSLERSDYWGDLVSDAQYRRLIVNVSLFTCQCFLLIFFF